MAATLSTLRIADVVKVRAESLASDGTPGHVTPESPAWSLGAANGTATIDPDPKDAYLVAVTAVASGSDDLYFDAKNVFGDSIQGHATITVLNAFAIGFSIENPFVLKDLTGIYPNGNPSVEVTAFGIDSRHASEGGSPAYALTSVSWARSNNNVFFDIGAGPVSTNPVTGVLSLKLWGMDDGTCTITVTATNSASVVITGQLLVTVVGTLVIGVEIVE